MGNNLTTAGVSLFCETIKSYHPFVKKADRGVGGGKSLEVVQYTPSVARPLPVGLRTPTPGWNLERYRQSSEFIRAYNSTKPTKLALQAVPSEDGTLQTRSLGTAFRASLAGLLLYLS